jgi:hypothetical protein
MNFRRSILIAVLSVFLQALFGLTVAAEDVSIYADAATIEVVTNDQDGEVRETTIWVVVVDDAPYINTSGTTWGENVTRTPQLTVRLAGSSRAFDILFVEDDSSRQKIHHAFREKYGFQDKLVSLFRDPAESTIMQLIDTKDVE